MAAVNEFTTKCEYCGGLLEYHSYGVVKCSCCNTIFKIETKNPDSLNKANELRINNSFGEALSLYNEILSKDPNFPEANWGALLSEYGVEYVNENGKLIPTIHRPVQNFKITEDKYATTLLNNTYGDERNEYLVKINELESLREEIEKTCKNSPKYDVFLSCKITNPNASIEEKTEEYKWAKQVYQSLTMRGLKVFFSPVSLPATNGAYEPIIYSALQSAKYLVVFASDIEYLNSKWIQNEWSRFLEIRKRDKENIRYYKLVIDNRVAKDVPSELKEVSFISHDSHKSWLTQVENAVLAVFPDVKNSTPVITTGGLEAIGKKGNKKLQATEVLHAADTMLILPQNPYTIHYHELDEHYTIEDNVATCIHMVEIHLRNGNYRDAQYELRKYLNFVSDESDLDFNILVLKMLIETKSKSLEDFYEDKISCFENYELFERIIKKLPAKDAENFLKPICEYIVNSIKNHSDNNSFELYNRLANINIDLILQLNYDVLQCLPYLYSNANLLMKFARISIPYVSSNNLQDYINLCSDLASGLCKNALWKEAEEIASKLRIADAQNSKIALVTLMIDNHSRVIDDLMENIEKKNDYYKIEDLIPNLYLTGLSHLLGVIKARILYLIDNSKFEAAAQWTEIVAKTEFDDREEYFISLIDRCKNIPQSEAIFNIAIHTLDEEKRDYFIKVTLEFIKGLLFAGYYSTAKKYCMELNEYDEDNTHVLNFYLCAELEAANPRIAFDSIYKLKDMSIVEKLALTKDTVYARQDLLTMFINSCITYLDENEIDQDNEVFVVFDKLLTYFTFIDNRLINKVFIFAEKCLQKGLFEKAKWYYIIIIRWEEDFHKAYWGIIMANNHCKTNEELIQIRESLDSMPEYHLAVKYANGNKEYEDLYINVLSQQLHYIKKQALPKKMLLIGGLVVIAIIIAIVLL